MEDWPSRFGIGMLQIPILRKIWGGLELKINKVETKIFECPAERKVEKWKRRFEQKYFKYLFWRRTRKLSKRVAMKMLLIPTTPSAQLLMSPLCLLQKRSLFFSRLFFCPQPSFFCKIVCIHINEILICMVILMKTDFS